MDNNEDVGITIGVFNDALKVAMWAARLGYSNRDCVGFVGYVTGRGYLSWPEYWPGLMLDYLAETRN